MADTHLPFEEVFASLASKHGIAEFDYADSGVSIKKVVSEHFSAQPEKSPHGFYVIRRKNNREVLYVGKSGTGADGRYQGQTLPGRLTNRRGDISAVQWFREMVEKEGRVVIQYGALTDPRTESPAFVEAMLLQAFLTENERLPRYNKSL